MWQSRAAWHNVIVYGLSAEYAARIQPASLVFVEGEISYREYEREIETAKGSVTVKWPIVELVASSINAITPKAEKGVAA